MSTEETIQQVTETLNRVNDRWDALVAKAQESARQLEEQTKEFRQRLQMNFEG